MAVFTGIRARVPIADTLWQMLRDIIKSSTRARENLGYEVVDPPARIGHKALAHHFARGYSKWAPLIERFDLADEEHRAFIFGDPSSEADASERRQSDSSLSGDDSDQDDEHKWDHDAQKYSEEYALWWEQRNEPTLASHLRGPLRCSCLSSADGGVQLGPGVALLYACSWCSCRTAMVRKCSRCEDAWWVTSIDLHFLAVLPLIAICPGTVMLTASERTGRNIDWCAGNHDRPGFLIFAHKSRFR